MNTIILLVKGLYLKIKNIVDKDNKKNKWYSKLGLKIKKNKSGQFLGSSIRYAKVCKLQEKLTTKLFISAKYI